MRLQNGDAIADVEFGAFLGFPEHVDVEEKDKYV